MTWLTWRTTLYFCSNNPPREGLSTVSKENGRRTTYPCVCEECELMVHLGCSYCISTTVMCSWMFGLSHLVGMHLDWRMLRHLSTACRPLSRRRIIFKFSYARECTSCRAMWNFWTLPLGSYPRVVLLSSTPHSTLDIHPYFMSYVGHVSSFNCIHSTSLPEMLICLSITCLSIMCNTLYISHPKLPVLASIVDICIHAVEQQWFIRDYGMYFLSTEC
jgi:hypothetical protein